jgi:hypothetical protein
MSVLRILIFSLLLAGVPVLSATASTGPHISINEILASNSKGIEDEDGDTVPWIELYNGGDEPVNLSFFGLSDDPERPWRWLIPDTTLQPGAFLLIFASGKDRATPGRPLHANFRVSRDGEPVTLTDINGNRIDHVPPTPMPVDISFGRFPDGSDNWVFFDRPTPGGPNRDGGFDDLLAPPVFSHHGGFYTVELDLSLAAGNAHEGTSLSAFESAATGTVIRYTLDGSEPDSTSPRYTDGPSASGTAPRIPTVYPPYRPRRRTSP